MPAVGGRPYAERMPHPAPDRRRSALRVWIPVVVSLIVQLVTTTAVIGISAARWHAQQRPMRSPVNPLLDLAAHPVPPWVPAVLLPLALAGPALLLAMRRRPGPALAGVTVAAMAGTVLCAAQSYGAPFYVSVLFGAAGASYLRLRAWAWCCAGAYWLTFAAAFLLTGNVVQLSWLVPLTLLSIGALIGPEFGRNRQEARARQLRDAEARRAEEAQAERVRIARELHDVLAHSLSQINVQASVGLHLFDSQPGKAAEALANVKDTSKQALDEVREVLGMLRGDEAPLAPGHDLAGIRELVDGARAQGLDATMGYEVPDAARIAAATQQAAYRIVQEALTNVTKHARARRVEVAVAVAGERLRVRVADDGVGAAAAASPDGRGLLGMRERAELLGGGFSAQPRPAGGFEVTAELPIGGAA
jgi:signal transduction histidine kinase